MSSLEIAKVKSHVVSLHKYSFLLFAAVVGPDHSALSCLATRPYPIPPAFVVVWSRWRSIDRANDEIRYLRNYPPYPVVGATAAASKVPLRRTANMKSR